MKDNTEAFADNDNVIYEICNEPNRSMQDWMMKQKWYCCIYSGWVYCLTDVERNQDGTKI